MGAKHNKREVRFSKYDPSGNSTGGTPSFHLTTGQGVVPAHILHPHSLKWYFSPQTLECDNLHITFTLSLPPGAQGPVSVRVGPGVSEQELSGFLDHLHRLSGVPPYGVWSVWFSNVDGTPNTQSSQVELSRHLRCVPRVWDGTELWRDFFLYQLGAHSVLESLLTRDQNARELCEHVLQRGPLQFGLFPWPPQHNVCLYTVDVLRHAPWNLPYTCMFSSETRLYGVRLCSLLEELFKRCGGRRVGAVAQGGAPVLESVGHALSFALSKDTTWGLWSAFQTKAMECAYEVFVRVEDMTRKRFVLAKCVHTDGKGVPVYRVYFTRSTFRPDLPPSVDQLSPEDARARGEVKRRSLFDRVDLSDIELVFLSQDGDVGGGGELVGLDDEDIEFTGD